MVYEGQVGGDGVAEGYGKLFYGSGEVQYEGQFVGNVCEGRGLEYSESGC